jgi:FKBP-type peptidyl-prolyl cis-trans isomerase SlyD
MDIANNCVVSIHYTLTDEAGETLDTSSGGDPLNYLHGHNGLIPGLEKELAGRVVGDAFQAVIQPEDAYGMVDREMVQEVPLEALAGIENLAVGMQLQSQGQDGSVQVVVVDALGAETATLNANHVLAGQVLTFDVTIESVREASAEELEHGHAH